MSALAALPAATTAVVTVAEPSVFLTLKHEASTMTSITVSWSVNSTESKETTARASPVIYHVEALSLATGVRLISPDLTVNDTEYTMPDLAVDSQYELCVVSNGSAEPACATLGTIPVVRDDSLIALLIALAVLLAIILIAVILWRCAVRRAGAGDEAADTPSEEKPDNEDDEKHGLNEKAPLLVPATTASPPPPEPATTQPDPSKQEEPQSLYLFLAGHAFK